MTEIQKSISLVKLGFILGGFAEISVLHAIATK